MNVLLIAVNAKYIHSNLAVYSLKTSAGKYQAQIDLQEFTINQSLDHIFSDICQKKPDLLFFSCYIWNRREILELSENLKKVIPGVVMWIGGPEVSWDAQCFLREAPWFDGVMTGEGEKTFYRVLDYYLGKNGALEEIPGIVWKEKDDPEKKHPYLPVCEMQDLDELPFVYQDLTSFENRILYYESSRGCPFSCSYCLSSLEKRVRFRNLKLVKKELDFFLEHKVSQVKFVDRTFNCSHEHAMAIWQHILEHDNGITNFHFEISADLLREEELELLARMRPGLVQLEIGVQTVNPKTLSAIRRTAPFEKIAACSRRIAEAHNIHQHLDLIAGLPYEDYESFGHSFDAVYRLHPQELQLGFLKVLRGSLMYEKAQEYGLLYRSQPPYEVLETRWISALELLRLKEIEDMAEVYYNSQQYLTTITALEEEWERPFLLYEALADFYKEQEDGGRSYTRMQRLDLLRNFILIRLQPSAQKQKFYEACLLKDLYLRENAKSRPIWAGETGADHEKAAAFYQREEREHEYLSGYEGRTWKQMMKMTHLECLDGEWILFDYSQRDPLTYAARMVSLPPEKMVPKEKSGKQVEK